MLNFSRIHIIATIIVSSIIIIWLVILYYKPNYRPGYQLHARNAKILLLSCMDFRLIDDMVYKLIQHGEVNNYDQFILAGASLGYNAKPDWAGVFEEHVETSLALHDIKYIYIMDHLQCGMYKKHYGSQLDATNEIALHRENLQASINKLEARFPGKFKYKTFIMALDGSLV